MGSSKAGEVDDLSVLGFTSDSSVFVYETFGEYDAIVGSYSNLYFLETKTGRPLPGTPFRLFCREEDKKFSPQARCKPMPSVFQLRKQTMRQATFLV
jgi:predicted secreted protein